MSLTRRQGYGKIGGMDTNTALTTAQARRWGRWLADNGASNVKVIESISYGTVTIAYDNRCGMPRSIATQADFLEAKETYA